MTTTDESLPILDLRLATSSVPDERRAFTERLVQATSDWGFFLLVGHGIPDDLGPRFVQLAREFFALPLDEKLQIDKTRSPQYRGYSRLGSELTKGRADQREQIDISDESPIVERVDPDHPWDILRGPNQWPAQVPGLRTVADEWMTHGERIARVLLSAWLEALDQRPDLLDDAFTRPDQRLKIVRYPEVDETEAEAAGAQGVGSHKDAGAITVLYVEQGKGGLQVERHGQWLDAPVVDGALVVNIGEMLEQATSGILRATRHRVVSPAVGKGDRISIPYFFGPDLSVTFPTWPLSDELAARAPGAEVEGHNRILADYGLNVLKSWMRSHPSVTEKYHAELAQRLDLPR